MADVRYQTRPAPGVARAEIDQGLRSYMLGVYNYMALGVAVTAIITMAVASSPASLAAVSSLSLGVLHRHDRPRLLCPAADLLRQYRPRPCRLLELMWRCGDWRSRRWSAVYLGH